MSFRVNTHLPARSDIYCPRCNDQLLFDDPIFDATSRRDGSRICNACGMIEALRDHGRRGDRPGHQYGGNINEQP